MILTSIDQKDSKSRPAPLAGKPPFATDDDDAIFENAPTPQKRILQKPAVPNRDSAYNHYDQYLSDSNEDNRASAYSTTGIGMGLMNSIDDSDSDSDGDFEMVSTPVPTTPNPPAYSNNGSTAAREAARPEKSPSATAVRSMPQPGASSSSNQDLPRGQALPSNPATGILKPTQPLRPAAAPTPSPATPSLPASPAGMRSPPPLAAPVAQYASSNPSRPMPAFMRPNTTASPSPSFATPVDLPSASPINPKIAAPTPSVKFSEKDPMPILRGDSEETLLSRSTVGSRPARHGDDFWRRFSMVAHKQEDKRKSLDWLQKNQARGNRFKGMMWACGFIVVALVAGGVVLAWFLTRKNPDHGIPSAVGGRGKQGFDPSSTSTAPAFADTTVPIATIPTGTTTSHKTKATKHADRRNILEGLANDLLESRRLHRVSFHGKSKSKSKFKSKPRPKHQLNHP